MQNGEEEQDSFTRRVVGPLIRVGRYDEACALLQERLSAETDTWFRIQLMSELSHVYSLAGRANESLAWAERLTDEAPDDPFVWNSLALWYLYCTPRKPPSAEDLSNGLRHIDRALALAYRADTWIRHVLFDRGRIANAAARYDIIEEVMRALIEDAPKSRASDIPMIETDFLDGLPPGAVDPELRARFFAAMRKAVRIRPQMRDDPGAFEE